MFLTVVETMSWSWGSRAAGNEAVAQNWARTREVVTTSRDSRPIAQWASRNTVSASRLPPRNRPTRTSCEKVTCDPGLRRNTGRSGPGPELLQPSEVGSQRLGDAHAPARGLVVLEQRGHGPGQRDARGVQRVRVLDLGAGLAPEPHVHAPGLEVLEVGARRALEPRLRPGGPHVEVVALGRREAEIPAAQQHHAVGERQGLEHVRAVRGEPL